MKLGLYIHIHLQIYIYIYICIYIYIYIYTYTHTHIYTHTHTHIYILYIYNFFLQRGKLSGTVATQLVFSDIAIITHNENFKSAGNIFGLNQMVD